MNKERNGRKRDHSVAARSRVADMKKQASSTFLMWVMVISLHAHLIIAAVSKSNGTISVCDGSVEDCLNVVHLDSELLPTISSSHFRRILAGKYDGVTNDALIPDKPFKGCKIGEAYRSCLAQVEGRARNCAIYNRVC
ncbi:hypothetical protein JHK87_022283 [Glycine soja]|nr:hypothetical protein JHK87_022283 [Glycine soja]